MTNFEQSLKDHADEFYIVPSKKVWHGIYNDLHPGSKWPSIVMGLVFLFTLIGIGHLNNSPKQSIDNDHQIEKVTSEVSANNEVASTEFSPLINREKRENPTKISADLLVENVNPNAGIVVAANSANMLTSKHSPVISERIGAKIFEKSNNINSIPRENEPANSSHGKMILPINSSENTSGVFSNPQNKPIVANEGFYNPDVVKNNMALNNNSMDYVTATLENKILLPEVFFFDNNAITTTAPLIINVRNQKEAIIGNDESINTEKKTAGIRKKRNEKISWVYFVTPTITSVYFTGMAIPPTPASNLSPIVIRNQPGNNMISNARLGFETGTEMIYTFAKKWSFTTGAHLTYSGYNIISDQVHPTFASLVLRNNSGATFSKSYITHYGSGQGQNQISLKNYNLQVSAPVGLQYVLWGNKNLQINIASTIEPSFVLKSNAYLISSDGKNYVNDPDLMRKINLSGNFGSYVTFSSNKLKWRVGPSVRYQVLSTYQNIYPIKEHLIDYGIRIGISK